MDEQDEYILEDEALKIFSLFPKRQINALNTTPSIFSKLFDSLTCTICRQIFTSPVYLKCSHRFCKECIEKYIRSNNKKSCPNCRGGLTTKRDLRLDYNLESLINYAYGDPKKLMKSIEDIDRMQINNKYFQMNRLQYLSQTKKRNKSQSFQENIVPPTSKRIKSSIDGQQPRRKRQESSKKIQAKIESDKQLPSSTKNIASSAEQAKKPIKQNEKNIIISRKKNKNNVQIIQIFESQEQVEQIPKQQFNNYTDLIESKLCSIKMIPQVSQIQSMKHFSSFQDQYKETNYQPQESNKGKINSSKDINQEPSHEEKSHLENQVQRCRDLLKDQFGELFITKVIELANFQIFTYIMIEPYPNPFIPKLEFKIIKISSRAAVQSLISLISSSLNIPKQSLKLYVSSCSSPQANDYLQIHSYLKIYQLNEKYWRQNEGFEIFQLSQQLKKDKNNQQRRVHKKVVYFMVDYNKILI